MPLSIHSSSLGALPEAGALPAEPGQQGDCGADPGPGGRGLGWPEGAILGFAPETSQVVPSREAPNELALVVVRDGLGCRGDPPFQGCELLVAWREHSGGDERGPQEGHRLVRQQRVQAFMGEGAAAVYERVKDYAEAGLPQPLQSGLRSVGDQDVVHRLQIGTYRAVAAERIASLLITDAAVTASVAVQVLDRPAEPTGVV
ncbi:hypothetical protein ACIP4Y_35465 [Streptomyces sp. NPDC088810]|uniref:hypothetical protein n=1 Tax=Streptomyces sp. NPDC088810 TaxID=3365904 RepID=UPI00380A1196